MGLLVVALFVVGAAKADGIDPVMVVGGAGGCGTPSVVSTFPLTANAAGGSNSTTCPNGNVFPGPVFQNGTGSTITSITVSTTSPIGNPCGANSFFGGGDLFTTGACSYDSVTHLATVAFSGMGPCGGSIDIEVAVVGTCAGIAPGTDFFVSLGQSGWLALDGSPMNFSGVVTAPEPTSLTLLLGGIGLLGFLRRSRKAAA